MTDSNPIPDIEEHVRLYGLGRAEGLVAAGRLIIGFVRSEPPDVREKFLAGIEEQLAILRGQVDIDRAHRAGREAVFDGNAGGDS